MVPTQCHRPGPGLGARAGGGPELELEPDLPPDLNPVAYLEQLREPRFPADEHNGPSSSWVIGWRPGATDSAHPREPRRPDRPGHQRTGDPLPKPAKPEPGPSPVPTESPAIFSPGAPIGPRLAVAARLRSRHRGPWRRPLRAAPSRSQRIISRGIISRGIISHGVASRIVARCRNVLRRGTVVRAVLSTAGLRRGRARCRHRRTGPGRSGRPGRSVRSDRCDVADRHDRRTASPPSAIWRKR